MKKLSMQLLADTVVSRRKAMKITQAQLSKTTGINRGLLSRLESLDYVPAIEQLQALGEALNFEPTDMFVDTATSVTLSIILMCTSSQTSSVSTTYWKPAVIIQ